MSYNKKSKKLKINYQIKFNKQKIPFQNKFRNFKLNIKKYQNLTLGLKFGNETRIADESNQPQPPCSLV